MVELLDKLSLAFVSGEHERVLIVPDNHNVDWNAARGSMASSSMSAANCAARAWNALSGVRWDWINAQALEIQDNKIDNDGKLTLRVNGRMHHIGIGRALARTPVLMLIDDLHVRIAHATTGELLRELTIDPTRDYQPSGKTRYPTKATKTEP